MTDLFDFKSRRLRFAVVGHPVMHSKSPQIHEAFARQCNVSLSYEAIALDPIAFEQGVRNLQAGGMAGLNVTLPFKEAAFRLSDQVSERARIANAVNTLTFSGDDQLAGDNTDGIGLVRDLQQNLNIPCADARVLVVGAGGAARGIVQPLLQTGPACLVIANRTASRARELAASMGSPHRVYPCALDEVSDSFDLVINATAASLSSEVPALPEVVFHPKSHAYDLAYADQPTAFMRWALGLGAARAVDGLGMLVEQAAEAFWIWHRQRPQTASVISALRSGVR
jgi:shikimate dehydrogenase